jgi:transposase
VRFTIAFAIGVVYTKSMSSSHPTQQPPPRIVTADRSQISWEMVDIESLVPEEHRVRVIWTAVERLDLSAFYGEIVARGSTPGRPALDPKVLLALWLFATSEGVGSAAHLARLCERDMAYRWICGGLTPNHHTLSDFRTQHGDKVDALLTQVLASLMSTGLVTLKRVAQDGMRVRAHAGASSFKRRARVEACVENARAQIDALKAELASDTSASVSREKAAKQRVAAQQAKRLTAALAQFENVEKTYARTRSQRERNAAKRGKKLQDDGPRVSTTDPDARVMKMGDGGFRPAYNVQFATDTESRIIVGVAVTNVGSDRNEMVPMLEQIEQRTGKAPEQYLVDGGFSNRDAITHMEQRGIQIFAPVTKPRNPDIDPHARRRDDNDQLAQWRARMGTEEAKRVYRERGAVAECINADQRRWRNMQQMPSTGIDKALAHARLGALLHNLLRADMLMNAA